MKFKSFSLGLLVVAVITGCGGSGGASVNETIIVKVGPTPPPEPVPEPEPEPEPEPVLEPGVDFRTFLLSSTSVQMLPVEDNPFQNGHFYFPIDTVTDEVDVLTVVTDYFGIPYEIFAEGAEVPESHPWTIEILKLIERAQASGQPLMLQLGLVREGMVGRAVDDDGELKVDLTWAPVCYDFSLPETVEIGDAYVNYAKWMASHFKPTHVVNFTEANLYYAECGRAGPAWDNLVAIQRRAYDAIKEVVPEATVFASFHLETLYDKRLDGWDEEQFQDITKMNSDVFGMATYPFGLRKEDGQFLTPYDLPADYLSRVRTQHPEMERLLISETGWNSASIAVGDPDECIENLPYSDHTFAADYLEFVFNAAYNEKFELVNWFSFRDSIPEFVLSTCFARSDFTDPDDDACMGDFWCRAINFAKDTVDIPGTPQLFSEVLQKAFGAMGLREYDGTPKPMMMDRWLKEFNLPVDDPYAEFEDDPEAPAEDDSEAPAEDDA